ncbi:hypothetical protein EVAR_27071_1 [Eumeta japonica]|uniref:Uncharacterized protein n=1 Tax=Eumeta variegata TaxID=151549 RepID=A0A4C1ZTI7_EUMVA|nr:hypothetical protein EVAR_27071_1 [Eumeta japonica]
MHVAIACCPILGWRFASSGGCAKPKPRSSFRRCVYCSGQRDLASSTARYILVSYALVNVTAATIRTRSTIDIRHYHRREVTGFSCDVPPSQCPRYVEHAGHWNIIEVEQHSDSENSENDGVSSVKSHVSRNISLKNLIIERGAAKTTVHSFFAIEFPLVDTSSLPIFPRRTSFGSIVPSAARDPDLVVYPPRTPSTLRGRLSRGSHSMLMR